MAGAGEAESWVFPAWRREGYEKIVLQSNGRESVQKTVDILLEAFNDKMRGIRDKLQQGEFSLDIRKEKSVIRVVNYRNRLS